MSDFSIHCQKAAAALAAADMLRPEHPQWSVVPLFYSAREMMHALLSRESVPEFEKHPQRHVSEWRDDVRLKWGTTDAVAKHYGGISPSYKSLFFASHAVRYGEPFEDPGARFWAEYEHIKQWFLGKTEAPTG